MRPLSSNTEQLNPQPDDSWDKPILVRPRAPWWVRITLVAMALGFMAVFGIAIYLNPYRSDGNARKMETHTQLGLQPCSLKKMVGIPCPSCGMTTSFSLLIRGDVLNSMRANWVGTLLATFCLMYIPWAFISAIRARPMGIASIEWVLVRLIIVFIFLMLLRWGLVLLLTFLTANGKPV